LAVDVIAVHRSGEFFTTYRLMHAEATRLHEAGVTSLVVDRF
jgi:hypothetical protein